MAIVLTPEHERFIQSQIDAGQLIFTEKNGLVGLTLVQDVSNRTFPSSKFFTKIEGIRLVPYHS